MRPVALDVRKLQDRPLGGIGRMLENVVARLGEAVELVALADARRPAPRLPRGIRVVAMRSPGPARESLWLQTAVPRYLRDFDGIFHCPAYGLPFVMPVPMVVTIHDLTFEDHPEWFSPGRRLVYRAQARHAARKAAAILTVSEYVRCRILERYRPDPDRVLVARSGVDPRFRPDHDPAALAAFLAAAGVRAPYGVALSGAPRRGLEVALAAFGIARRRHPELSLVVVGPEGPVPMPPQLRRDRRARFPDRRFARARRVPSSSRPSPLSRDEGRVVWLGPLRDEELALLLAGASVFVYPTKEEGFGMPALEAAAAGTPVVCAPVGALPEVLGPAARWVPEPEPEPVAEGIAAVLSDASLAEHLRSAGLERARSLGGWDTAVAATLEAYARASDRGGVPLRARRKAA